MCRSIKTLRPPYAETVTDADMHAAALQYVRKVSGFRAPASHNAEAFERAVTEIAESTRVLLDALQVRGRLFALVDLCCQRVEELGHGQPDHLREIELECRCRLRCGALDNRLQQL